MGAGVDEIELAYRTEFRRYLRVATAITGRGNGLRRRRIVRGVAANGNQRGLTASWLGSRLGIGPTRVDLMRRGGELIGVREPGAQIYRYPSWQFGDGWEVKPIVARMVAAARARGIGDDRLGEILDMRVGMGGRRVEDLARDGDEEAVLRAIRSATVTRPR